MFVIVKFVGDGQAIEMIPRKWLSADKKSSKWPHYPIKNATHRSKLEMRDIRDMTDPDGTWKDSDIIKVYNISGESILCAGLLTP